MPKLAKMSTRQKERWKAMKVMHMVRYRPEPDVALINAIDPESSLG